jgi:uncharacterized protein (DUF1501 family)
MIRQLESKNCFDILPKAISTFPRQRRKRNGPSLGASTFESSCLNCQERLGQPFYTRSGFGTRVFYTIQGGYDTHASQRQSHGNLLGTLSAAISAFKLAQS